MALEKEIAEDLTMIHWERRINSRTYNVFSYIIVIVGTLLLIGGLCMLVIGLFR